MLLKIKLLVSILCCLALGACSGGGDGGSLNEVVGSSIDSLPSNTDPVVDNSSSGLASKAVAALEATTGLKLSEWSDTNNWQAGNSRAMCEVGQVVKESLSEAMNPDKIKCYVGAVARNSGLNILTNGSDNYLKLTNFPEQPNMEPRIRLRVTKDGSGRISRFEMWSCFQFDGSNFSQSEYILQSIDSDRNVTSYSKYLGTEDAENYGAASEVTGTLNSSFQWTSKSMAVENYYNGNFGSFSQELNITQRASSFVISGYNNGSWGQDIFENAFYAAVQGLSMSSPKDIALGDGSAKFDFNWCFDSDLDNDCSDEIGGNRHTDSDIQSWNGDTQANLGSASSGDYYSEVASASVPSVSTVAAMSFSGDEAWDCSSESFIEADLSNMENPNTSLGAAFQACDNKYNYRDETSGGYACDAAQ